MGRPKKIQETGENPIDNGISREEFEGFKEEQRKNTDKILGFLETMTAKEGTSKVDTAVKAEIKGREDDNSGEQIGDYMPPQYQKIFERYFSPEDGFTANLNFPEVDNKGNEMGGIMFTINVPLKLSNAQQAYLDYYKADKRSKPLQPGAVAKGIEEWCKKVANNLKYNKNLRIK